MTNYVAFLSMSKFFSQKKCTQYSSAIHHPPQSKLSRMSSVCSFCSKAGLKPSFLTHPLVYVGVPGSGCFHWQTLFEGCSCTFLYSSFPLPELPPKSFAKGLLMLRWRPLPCGASELCWSEHPVAAEWFVVLEENWFVWRWQRGSARNVNYLVTAWRTLGGRRNVTQIWQLLTTVSLWQKPK